MEQPEAQSHCVGDAGCATPAFKKRKQVVQHRYVLQGAVFGHYLRLFLFLFLAPSIWPVSEGVRAPGLTQTRRNGP